MAESFQFDRSKQESGSLSKEWLDWLNSNAVKTERRESDKETSEPASGN